MNIPNHTTTYTLEIFAASLFCTDTELETLLDILDDGDDCEAHSMSREILLRERKAT